MTALRSRALSALRDGRVTVSRAAPTDTAGRAHRITATVRSSRAEWPDHLVEFYGPSEWTCETAGTFCPQPCPHVAAVQLVTGWPSDAAKGADK